MYSIIKGVDTLSVFVNGVPYFFPVNEEKARHIIEMVKEGTTDEELLAYFKEDDLKEYCEDMKSDGIVITEDTILIDGEEISVALAEQIRRHYNDGLSVEPLVKFVQKVRLNPSYRIRNQLWAFIEASQNSGGFTLAEDGDILAYKKVRGDYKDIHSGMFDNSVGMVVEMERKNVDDDPNNTCSSGLHFCAYSYLASYGCSGDDRVMLVKVNPADVVSIPTDYNNAKARCCRYEVVQEIEHIIEEPVYSDYDDEDDSTDWEDDEEINSLIDIIMSHPKQVVINFCERMGFMVTKERENYLRDILEEVFDIYTYREVLSAWEDYREYEEGVKKEKEELFLKYGDNFKDKDKEYLYDFLNEIGEEWRLPTYYTYDDCIEAIKEFLYENDGEYGKVWKHIISFDYDKEDFEDSLEELIENHTKNELVSLYNFVTLKNYKFQSKTKWEMAEIVRELFNEMPITKNKDTFIKAWLASSKK